MTLSDYLSSLGAAWDLAFKWSPPRGGIHSSEISTDPTSTPDASAWKPKKGKGTGLRKEAERLEAEAQNFISRQPRSSTPRVVSGLHVPPGSNVPSSLSEAHFTEKRKRLSEAIPKSEDSSPSTPSSLSQLGLSSGAVTPSTLHSEREEPPVASGSALSTEPARVAYRDAAAEDEDSEDSEDEKFVDESLYDENSPPPQIDPDETFKVDEFELDLPEQTFEPARASSPRERHQTPPAAQIPLPPSPVMAEGGGISLPLPTSPNAPKFNGQPGDLVAYFQFFDGHKDTSGWPDETTIKTAIRYITDIKTRQLWALRDRSLVGAERTWAGFKKTMYDCYPGAEAMLRYEIADLDRLILKLREEGLGDRFHFQTYVNEFEVIAETLKDAQLMTDSGLNSKFRASLPEGTTRDIALNHYLDKTPENTPWRELAKRVGKILDASRGDRHESAAAAVEATRSTAASAPPAVTVKTEPVSEQTAALLAGYFARFMQGPPPPQQYQQPQMYPTPPDQSYGSAPAGGWHPPPAPAFAGAYALQSRPFTGKCVYCDAYGHQMRDCTVYTHDRRHNRAFYNFRDRVLEVDRVPVPIAPGGIPCNAVEEYRGSLFVGRPGTAAPASPAPQQQPEAQSRNPAPAGMARPVSTGMARAEEVVSESRTPTVEEYQTSASESGSEEYEPDETTSEEETDEGTQSESEEAILSTLTMAAKAISQQKEGKWEFAGVHLPVMNWKKDTTDKVGPPKGAKKKRRAKAKGKGKSPESKDGEPEPQPEVGEGVRKARKAAAADDPQAVAKKLAEKVSKRATDEKEEPKFHYGARTDNRDELVKVLQSCQKGLIPLTVRSLFATSDAFRAKVNAETRRRKVPNEQRDKEEEEAAQRLSAKEAAVLKLWNLFLDAPLALELADIMAASDFVRDTLHKETGKKAIMPPPVSTAASYTSPVGPIPQSANPSVAPRETPLWGIPATIWGANNEEILLTDVIVDSGAGLCAIRADIWEQTGREVEVNPVSCQMFGGDIVEYRHLVRNLPVSIGSVLVYIQAYVVKNLDSEMILGGPFEAVTRMRKATLKDARPVYRLTDPLGSGRTVEALGVTRSMGF